MNHARHRLFDAKRRNIYTAMRAGKLVYIFRARISEPPQTIRIRTDKLTPTVLKLLGGNE